jgi:hypothetical protein
MIYALESRSRVLTGQAASMNHVLSWHPPRICDHDLPVPTVGSFALSNWEACDVHLSSVYTSRGNKGRAQLDWQLRHTVPVTGSEGQSAGMTEEDLKTCLLMKGDEAR